MLTAVGMTMKHLLLTCLLASCAADASEPEQLTPSGPIGKGDGVCPTVNARIAPTAPPQYSCGPIDAVDAAIAADVNAFWGSQVVTCSCGPDFPEMCEGAYSLFFHGYVYLSLEFMHGLTASGSLTPTQYVYAHEFGHELEGHYDAYAPTTQQRELTADCLAGYYLGSLQCKGQTTERDIVTTLATACIIGDGSGDPIADLETHGTCEQRMEAIKAGMRAYLAGEAPLQACAL